MIPTHAHTYTVTILHIHTDTTSSSLTDTHTLLLRWAKCNAYYVSMLTDQNPSLTSTGWTEWNLKSQFHPISLVAMTFLLLSTHQVKIEKNDLEN